MRRSRSQRRTDADADADGRAGDVRTARQTDGEDGASSDEQTTTMAPAAAPPSFDAAAAAAESTSAVASPAFESGACPRRSPAAASFVAAPPSSRLDATEATPAAERRSQPFSFGPFDGAASAASAPPFVSPLSAVRPPRSALHRSAEVYGFVLWISTFVVALLYLAWALLPDASLHALGVTYYPSRWWALALPAWSTVALVSVPPLYLAWNMFNTLPLDHANTISDGWTHKQQQQIKRQQERQEKSARGNRAMDQSAAADPVSDWYSIPDCVDIPLERINRLLYRSAAEVGAVNVR